MAFELVFIYVIVVFVFIVNVFMVKLLSGVLWELIHKWSEINICLLELSVLGHSIQLLPSELINQVLLLLQASSLCLLGYLKIIES